MHLHNFQNLQCMTLLSTIRFGLEFFEILSMEILESRRSKRHLFLKLSLRTFIPFSFSSMSYFLLNGQCIINATLSCRQFTETARPTVLSFSLHTPHIPPILSLTIFFLMFLGLSACSYA